MKKILSTIIILLIFILIYFLQSNFFNWFNIAGASLIIENLMIVTYLPFMLTASLITGLFVGKIYGATTGIVLGLLLDFFIGKKLGIYAIQLGLAGLLRRNLQQKLFKR